MHKYNIFALINGSYINFWFIIYWSFEQVHLLKFDDQNRIVDRDNNTICLYRGIQLLIKIELFITNTYFSYYNHLLYIAWTPTLHIINNDVFIKNSIHRYKQMVLLTSSTILFWSSNYIIKLWMDEYV